MRSSWKSAVLIVDNLLPFTTKLRSIIADTFTNLLVNYVYNLCIAYRFVVFFIYHFYTILM